ncbi:MAG: NUDIX domain-containing protein [Candidatus Marsarchaeota archaeon]|nr:NUDIX domain-containing protein [Candidatus Marsarchaeota archaeon]
MDKRIIVWVGALLNNGHGKFLFLKRVKGSSWAGGQWQLPGGKMEWGESVMDTLNREINEETEGKIINPAFLGVYTMQINSNGSNFHAVMLVYKGNYSGKGINMSEDHDGYAWMSLKEAIGVDLMEGLGKFIKSHIE